MYQWKYQAPNNPEDTWTNCTSTQGTGYTTATLRVAADRTWNGYKYKCVVTDKNTKKTATSDASELIVLLFCVKTQPQGATVNPGDTVALTVGVEKGTAPYTYQWYFAPARDKDDDDHQSGQAFTSNQTSYTKEITVAANNCESRWYYCKITDSNGNTVKTEKVLVQYRITASIERTPSGDTVSHGTTVTMTAKVQGGAKLKASSGADRYTYVWYFIKQGTSAETVLGTGSTCTFIMNGDMLGNYYFVVTDALGDTRESFRDAILHN
jgi:hypothetical protein